MVLLRRLGCRRSDVEIPETLDAPRALKGHRDVIVEHVLASKQVVTTSTAIPPRSGLVVGARVADEIVVLVERHGALDALEWAIGKVTHLVPAKIPRLRKLRSQGGIRSEVSSKAHR